MKGPEVKDAPTSGEDIAAQISFTAQLTEKKHIVIQSYLPRDADVKDYNALLDKFGTALDRQEAKYNLTALKTSLEMHKKTLAQLKDDYAAIEGRSAAEWQRQGKKGEPKLSASEVAQKSTAGQNIKRYGVEVNKIEAEIAACEQVIAKDD